MSRGHESGNCSDWCDVLLLEVPGILRHGRRIDRAEPLDYNNEPITEKVRIDHQNDVDELMSKLSRMSQSEQITIKGK